MNRKTIIRDLLDTVMQTRPGFDAAVNRIRDLEDAAKRALNFIENTESELGIELDSGVRLRAALSASAGGDT